VAQGQQQHQDASPSGGDGLPEDLRLYSPFPFKGMDVKGSVIAIDDASFVWMENVVWIGDGQLALLGSNELLPLYTAPPGLTINSRGFFELAGVPYLAVFLSDGSAVRVQVSNGAQTAIGPAGTFDVSQEIATSQWAGKYLLIGTNSDYYAWDGVSLFGPGTLAPQITVTSGGDGYTSPPTVTITGGSGTGATAVAQISNGVVVEVDVTNPGHGYLPTDTLFLNVIFTGGGSSARAAQATATIGGGGVTAVQILDGGTGYTNEPAITFSGGGASTQATAVAQGTANSITAVIIVTPGVGYTSTPTVTFAAPSGGGDTATGVALIGLNGITGISITDGGSGYQTTPQVRVVDPFGFGSGFVGVATVATGAVTGVTITNPGSNYQGAVVLFEGGNPDVAAATATLMPQGGQNPISGIAIQVFKNRVWLVNKTFRYTTAAGSVSDFAASDGGVIAQNTDNDLVYQLYGLAQTSGFLYEFGDSSVNAISNPTATTTNAVTTTQYTVTNIDPQIGTLWPDTIQSFGEAVVFASPLGIFAVYGGTIRKISTELDDMFVNMSGAPSGTQLPSAAIVILFGIKFYALAIFIFDPIQQQRRQLILLWDGQKFFVATQDALITGLTTVNTGGTTNVYYTAYGQAGGTTIYRCFTRPSATLQKKLISKFYGGDSAQQYKQALRFYLSGEQSFTYTVNIHSDQNPDVNLTSVNYPPPTSGVNPYGLPLTMQRVDAQGASGIYLGWTLTTTQPSGNIDYMGLAYRYYSGF
jgi:hypothetical protein